MAAVQQQKKVGIAAIVYSFQYKLSDFPPTLSVFFPLLENKRQQKFIYIHCFRDSIVPRQKPNHSSMNMA